MATTPIATSGFTSIDLAGGSISMDGIRKMFAFVADPVHQDWVAMDMAAGITDDILLAPGANKRLYIWSVAITPNTASAAARYIGFTAAASPGVGDYIFGVAAAAAGAGTAPITPVLVQVLLPANLKLRATNLGASTAMNHNCYVKYCVVPA